MSTATRTTRPAARRLARAAAAVVLLAVPLSAHAQFGKLVKRASDAVRGGGGHAAAAAAPSAGAGRRAAYEACVERTLEEAMRSQATPAITPQAAQEYQALLLAAQAVGQRAMATPDGTPAREARTDSVTMYGERMMRLQYPAVGQRCGPEVWPDNGDGASAGPVPAVALGASSAATAAAALGGSPANARGVRADLPGAASVLSAAGNPAQAAAGALARMVPGGNTRVGGAALTVGAALATGGAPQLAATGLLRVGRAAMAARKARKAAGTAAAVASAGAPAGAAAEATPSSAPR